MPATPITSDTTTPGTNTRTVLSPPGTRFESPPRARFAPRGGLGGAAYAAPAQAAEVVSSNIVGYNKLTLTTQFTLVASQFNTVGAIAKNVQDFVATDNDLPGLDPDDGYAAQTELRYWNGTGYETYGWDPDGDPSIEGSDHKWVDETLAVADFSIPVGNAVWIKIPANTQSEILLSGEVLAGDSATESVRAGFTLIANPFPSTIDIQQIQPSENLPGLDPDDGYAAQTELRYWNGTGYDTFGWDPDGDPSIEGSDHKWVDETLAVAQKNIEIGKGFWIKTTQSGSVTISK